MQVIKSDRGFEFLVHPKYPPDGEQVRLASLSSAIGNYDDSFDRPGSSFLWVGDNHHLNREEVAELIQHLQNWLNTGTLSGK